MRGCKNPGSTFVVAGHGAANFVDVSVCTGHEAEIESGCHWDLRGSDVVMGRDMAPPLERWSLYPGMGTDGFTLILNAAGRVEPVQIFLTTAVARSLALFLYPSSGLALPPEFVAAVLEDDEDLDW